jgi:hypothetical protein
LLGMGNAAMSSRVDIRAGRHVSALIARHSQLQPVSHHAQTRLWAGGSPHAQFIAETNERARTAGLLPPDLEGQRRVADDAFRDPTFLYLGELRHQITARRNV